MSRPRKPAGRHRAGRHRASDGTRSRVTVAAGGTALLGAATAITLAVLNNGPAGATQPAAEAPVIPPITHSAPPSPSSTSAAPPSPSVVALRTLVSSHSTSSTSVAALDTVTGATASAGAASGMTTASAVKLQLLESLLLKRQDSDDTLSTGELAGAADMIEHSDNGAAEDVFWAIGGHDAVVDLEPDLGLSTTRTVMGDDDYWGLSTTSAAQQLVLLHNLLDPDGPLDAGSRALALHLMRNVDADQTWGVPVTATSGTPAVKNGWLDIDNDGGRWAVNSLGVVTVNGHTVLLAVMTQHNDSYADGVARVQRLARAAAAVVRS